MATVVEMAGDGRQVHPDCINASNPYHECVDFCFRRIAAARESRSDGATSISEEAAILPTSKEGKRKRDDNDEVPPVLNVTEVLPDGNAQPSEDQIPKEDQLPEGYPEMNERQKKFFELQLKMNAARKANQGAIIAEKKREEAPQEVRGVSKKKWFEEKQKQIGKRLESCGLDMSKAYMLDTQEQAEGKYKNWEKEPAPFGWDVFNQRSLYKAYKKRTKNVPYSKEDYEKAKEADPDFYRDGSSLQYGKVPNIPEENVNKMVQELQERAKSRKEFSRRRKFHEEKDIDSISDRNEHFNRKIERAFGRYTVEIKNNLERGTALPD